MFTIHLLRDHKMGAGIFFLVTELYVSYVRS